MKIILTALSLLISVAVADEKAVGPNVTSVSSTDGYRTIWVGVEPDARVLIDGKYEDVHFEPAAVVVEVRLQSGDTNSVNAYPRDWTRDVHFLVTPERSDQREVMATVIRQDDERVEIEGKHVDHWVRAEFRLKTMGRGRYELTTTYGDLSQKTPGKIMVVRGDETPEIRQWALQRQIEKSKSWDETKKLLLEQIEINPRNATAWLTLAAGGERYDDYETTKGYYEKSIAVLKQIGDSDATREIHDIERILELLPAYYADREHLQIVREKTLMSAPAIIELRERKTPLRSEKPNQPKQ